MRTIDFHSHILPNMDDGAKDLETAVTMLSASRRDGVDLMVSTSHYYAHREPIQTFVARRVEAAARLREETKRQGIDIPGIRLGAEVYLERGLAEEQDLPALCVEGTDVLLLELPYSFWDDWVYDEIYRISANFGIAIVLAHLERYVEKPREIGKLDRLLALNVQVQVNAGSVCDRRASKIVKKMARRDAVHLLGSDCHNMGTRPPGLRTALDCLERLCGNGFAKRVMNHAETLLHKENEGAKEGQA